MKQRLKNAFYRRKPNFQGLLRLTALAALVFTAAVSHGVEWGIHEPELNDSDVEYEAYAELNPKWFRISASPRDTPKISEGVYDYRWFDPMVEAYRSRGYKLVICFWEDPIPLTDPERAAFAAWAAALVNRYKDCNYLWEIWNEPNIAEFWPNPDPAAYTQLALETGAAIRAVAPDEKIVGLSMAGVDLPFTEACLQRGLGAIADLISVHPYVWQGPEILPPYYQSLRELFARYGLAGLPLMSGEQGYPSFDSTFGIPNANETWQAKMAARQLVVNEASGLIATIFYTWRDYTTEMLPGWWNHCGLVRAYTGPPASLEKKEAFYAAAAMHQRLRDATFVGPLAVQGGGSNLAYRFATEAGDVIVAWTTDPVSHSITLPDYTSGDFEIVDYLGGNRQTISAGPGGLTFTVSDGVSYVTRSGANQPPILTEQPATQTIQMDRPVTFRVRAAGAEPFQYQWFRNGEPVSGATSADFTIGSASPDDDESEFYCEVRNADGMTQSADATLFVFAPSVRPTGDNLWGMQLMDLPVPTEIDKFAELRTKYVRIGFYKEWTPKRPDGTYDFSRYDQHVDWLRAAGIKMIAGLYTDDKPTTEELRQEVADWAAQAVSHYQGQAHIWEWWNEPHPLTWPAPNFSLAVKAIGRAIKKADPNAIFVTAGYVNCLGCTDIDDHMRDCFGAGILRWVDAVSLHPYFHNPPEEAAMSYQRVRDLMAPHLPPGKNLYFVNSELGKASAYDEGASEAQQAFYVVRQRLLDVLEGLTPQIPVLVTNWYMWRDVDPREFGGMEEDWTTNCGLVRRYQQPPPAQFSFKPSYFAARKMNQFLQGSSLERRLNIGSAEDFILQFIDGPDTKWVAWRTGGTSRVTILLPAGTYEISDHLGNPPQTVTVGQNGHTLTLSEAPRFIERAGAPPANNPPEITGLTATPNPALTNEEIVFRINASDADGDPLTFDWDFGDGQRAAGPDATHRFAAAGTYTVTCVVNDGQESVSRTVSVVVRNPPPPANRAPSANAGLPQTITLPSPAQLSGTATDDGLPNPPGRLSILWSLVSGPSGADIVAPDRPATSVTFQLPGTYVFRLRAYDGEMADEKEVAVVVRSAVAAVAPARISAWPNPLVRSRDTSMTISGLESGHRVTIYDRRGNLIWETTATGSNVIWNGSDSSQQPVSSGVYRVHVEPEGEPFTVSVIK